MRWPCQLLCFLLAMGVYSELPAATFVVTNSNDSGLGSLRQAILDASTNPGPDVVTFSNVIGTIAVSFSISLQDIFLLGPGAHALTIKHEPPNPNGYGPLIYVSGSATISGLKLEGSYNLINSYAGVIANGGNLLLSDCEVVGGYVTYGGGIYNSGVLVINGSTIMGNTAYATGSIYPTQGCIAGAGGGIYCAGGSIFITNSTISSNTAGSFLYCIGHGAAIYVNAGNVVLANCTVSDNFGANEAPISGPATLVNTIVVSRSFSDVNVSANNLFASSREAIRLGPLQDNGGPTLTHALLNGSPAIEAGTADSAPTTDQIGVSRPQGTRVDIGAAEFVWPPNSYSLLVNITGPGTVTRDLDLMIFPSNSLVTLKALGAEDYSLANWSGDATGSTNPLSVRMSQNKTIGATFVWAPATVTNVPGSTNLVTNTDPWGPGSLRQAIRNVNASGGGVIRFSNALGTISLASELPALHYNTVIRGPGQDRLIIESPHDTGTFIVESGSTSSIAGLTIRYSHPTNHSGGAIFNAGRLSLTNVGVFSCSSQTNGGAIFNSGSLTVFNSILSGNWCDYGSGGAIYNSGGLVVISTEISSNNVHSAQFDYSSPNSPILAGGGGIFSATGGVRLLNCRVVGNQVTGGAAVSYSGLDGDLGLGGGLMLANGRMSLISCTIASNTAFGGYGRTTLNGRNAGSGGPGRGGGLSANGGTLFVTNCAFLNNYAEGGNGGSGYGSGFYGSGGGTGGGGGLNMETSATGVLANCTISFNQSIGGVGYRWVPPMYVRVGSPAYGGGLHFVGNALLLHCTIASNNVAGGVGDSGNGIGKGSALYKQDYSSSTVAALQNTIVVGDLAGLPITSLGHNIFANGATGAISFDLQGVEPRLGPLQDNGGPTWSHALLAGSPAIDGGVSTGIPFDQRGQPRTIDISSVPNAADGDGTDIGSLEVDPVLRLTQAFKSGTSILLKFTTVSDKFYGIQARAHATYGPWSGLPPVVAGTGGIVTVSNEISSSATETYFRVVEQPQ